MKNAPPRKTKQGKIISYQRSNLREHRRKRLLGALGRQMLLSTRLKNIAGRLENLNLLRWNRHSLLLGRITTPQR